MWHLMAEMLLARTQLKLRGSNLPVLELFWLKSNCKYLAKIENSNLFHCVHPFKLFSTYNCEVGVSLWDGLYFNSVGYASFMAEMGL